MRTCESLRRSLSAGECDQTLASLYALDGADSSLAAARARALRAVEEFQSAFSPAEDTAAALFSGPGRTEIGGNHTDHQHGHVLCGSVDLDMICCAAPNGLNVIRIISEGYPALEVELDQLLPRPEERNTSAALVRGVAAKIQELGHKVGGFDAWATSSVLSGSGLSSSAAYEVLVGNIVNHFFCEGALTPIQIAKIGQYAENVYFGKPSGLMDQMASSVGGLVAIDFADPAAPGVERVDFDFSRCGHRLCIIDSGADHADLTDEYAAIPVEMKRIAAHFGKEVLRDVDEAAFYAALPALRQESGDRAVLRAIHFFEENRRVQAQVAALRRGDFAEFLHLVTASGLASWTLLQNVTPAGSTAHQDMAVTLALCAKLLGGRGAVRIHGGGFAGTALAFVPDDTFEDFRSGVEAALGQGRCKPLAIV